MSSKYLNGDPRRPNEVKRYERPVVNPDEEPPEPMMIGALALGVIGLMMKIKLAAWGGLVCCLSSLATMKSSSMDLKQIVSSVTFSVMGLLASYLMPAQQNKG
eukprot:TRINITY_DN3997_c0_g2_i1.p3 TRINITY_DN3997_c0_g2~~TRINITY_DN3997_c0_g2_i1.p3  ORF type:complete len:103 (-),score=21.43 TRINITY_DN3997_c0_g2_i1:192-500(-)